MIGIWKSRMWFLTIQASDRMALIAPHDAIKPVTLILFLFINHSCSSPPRHSPHSLSFSSYPAIPSFSTYRDHLIVR